MLLHGCAGCVPTADAGVRNEGLDPDTFVGLNVGADAGAGATVDAGAVPTLVGVGLCAWGLSGGNTTPMAAKITAKTATTWDALIQGDLPAEAFL